MFSLAGLKWPQTVVQMNYKTYYTMRLIIWQQFESCSIQVCQNSVKEEINRCKSFGCSPGVCSCWVMASHWSPDQAESGLHIKHVLFSDKPGDLYIHLYSNRHLLLMNTNYINNRITTEIPEVLVFCFVEFFEFVFWEGK